MSIKSQLKRLLDLETRRRRKKKKKLPPRKSNGEFRKRR
jgi:hypothetical protein